MYFYHSQTRLKKFQYTQEQVVFLNLIHEEKYICKQKITSNGIFLARCGNKKERVIKIKVFITEY